MKPIYLKPSKKILIASSLDIWSMDKNKGATSLWRTLESYANHGFDVTFLTSGKAPKNNLNKKIKIKKFPRSWLTAFFNIRKFGFFARSLWWFYFQIVCIFQGWKIARKEGIDVFYGYESHGVFATKVLSTIFKKPLVSRFQGTILSKYLTGRHLLWRFRNWWHVLALKTSSDLIVMTNDGTRGDEVLNLLGADMSKVRFWINGIDKSVFKPDRPSVKLKNKLSISTDQKILLTVSRLEKWKRVDRTIKSMPLLLQKFPNTKVIIVGDGSERKKLEKMVEDLNLSKNVIFAGAVSQNQLPKYYNVADIFISMYDISNVGNPLFEALSCGKCIVAFDVGDTNKFIISGTNGILVKRPSPEEIAAKLTDLFANESRIKHLGQNAKKSADQNLWSWEKRMYAELKEAEKLLSLSV